MCWLQGALIDYLQLGQRVVVYEGRAVNKRFTEVNLHFPVATTRLTRFCVNYLQNINVLDIINSCALTSLQIICLLSIRCRVEPLYRSFRAQNVNIRVFVNHYSYLIESNVCVVWITVYRLVFGTKALSHPLYLLFVMQQTFYWTHYCFFF